MTYLIGDKSISLNDSTLTAAEEDLIRAHPEVFRYCLNAAARSYLLSTKKIVHLYADIITIYSTLISKIPHYEDLRLLTTKSRVGLTRLEADFNTVFGSEVDVPSDGWEQKNYETMVKKMALVVLQSCADTFDLVYKTLSCIEVFFESFDNLRKLLIPCLLAHTRMVQKSVVGAGCFFRLPTIVNQIGMLPVFTPSVVKQLAKIDTITRGIERESKLLDMVFGSVNPSLKQYTAILLGKAILKRHIPENDCRLIHRREVCFQAAEHVVSIPLTGTPTSKSYMHQFTKHIFYFFSAILVVIIAVLYRLYNVVFG